MPQFRTQTVVLMGVMGKIEVAVSFKDMKTCRLRVDLDAKVKLSVPKRMTKKCVVDFLNRHIRWIEEQQEKITARKVESLIPAFFTGNSVTFLGKPLLLSLHNGVNSVWRESMQGVEYLHLQIPDMGQVDKLNNLFDCWWRETAQEILSERFVYFFPRLGMGEDSFPQIRLRKMRTLWGSCSPTKRVITVNQFLTKASISCVDYVVWHELVHLVHPNHSKEFYQYLATHMPDWKARKDKLNTSVILR